MTDKVVPKISKIPFILGDLVLLAIAGWIMLQAPRPLDPTFVAVAALCGFGGAFLAVLPFLRDFQGALKLAEQDRLADTLSQIKMLEKAAAQIGNATGHWQQIQETALKTVGSCQEIGDRMTAEAKAFADFLQKANDSEKNHLRLEVDKLKRGEGEWLQMLVHMLDHVFALYQAGLRSGQENLIGQLTGFQRACRDVVRRVGLVPLPSDQGAAFDASLHLLPREEDPLPENARIVETLAPGYTFQGQLLRKAIVKVDSNGHAPLEEQNLSNKKEATPIESDNAGLPKEREQQLL